MGKLRLLLAVLLFPMVVHAHQDRILSVRPDGTIPEIPSSFGPVSLKISGLGGSEPAVEFRTPSGRNVLPKCLTRLLGKVRQDGVFVTGSWYHEEIVLPYYVNVEFRDPGYSKARSFNSKLSIIFDLRTAEIIDINRLVANRSGTRAQFVPIDIPKGCVSIKGPRIAN